MRKYRFVLAALLVLLWLTPLSAAPAAADGFCTGSEVPSGFGIDSGGAYVNCMNPSTGAIRKVYL